jgi:hypothetical protein
MIVAHDLSRYSLSQNDARLYFSMQRRRWTDNRLVKLTVLPHDHPLHAAFANNVLGLLPCQLRNVWDLQLLYGTGQAPIAGSTKEEMIDESLYPGASGYVPVKLPDPASDRWSCTEVRSAIVIAVLLVVL